MKKIRELTEKEKADGWKVTSTSPAGKSDSGNFFKDCVLLQGTTGAAKVIGICIWLFFILWLAGMTLIFWASANGYLDRV